jgi:NitT/TauT family transport system ATP-binding protein
VTLPHPRDRKAPEFVEFVDRAYGILAGQTEAENVELGTAPGEPGITRALPHVEINEISGLLERIEDFGHGKEDIYLLREQLGLDSDRLLKLTEATELLGFATVAQGDITLTSLGQTFADASILARKEILATRIRRLPLFRWLMTMIKASKGKQLDWDVVIAALELDFPSEEAERQLSTAINWGRYAELFAYDDDDALIYIPEETPVS